MTASAPVGGGARGWRAALAAQVRRRGAAAGSIATLALKVGGTSLMMGIFLLAARGMSPQGFGRLAVSFNALSFTAVLAVFGQDVLMIRSWGEYANTGAHGLALGAYRFTGAVVLGAAALFGALALGIGVLDPHLGFALPEVAAAAAFLSLQILWLYAVQTTRVILGVAVSEVNRELTWRLVLLPVVVAGLWTGLTPAAFYAGAALGLAASVGIQVAALWRRFPAAVRTARPEMRRREWVGRARVIWLSAVLEAAAQYAEVLLLGVLASPATAGVYFVAARMANVFAMMAGGLHSYTDAHVAAMFYAGRRDALQGVYRSVMGVAVLIAAPVLLVVVGLGGPILDLYGRHFADGYPALILLSVGSFTAAMAGPTNGLLLVTGHETLYARVLFAALLLRVGLIAWAAPRFGAVGAAAAWTAVNAPVAIGLAVAARRLTGLDVSALCALRRGRAGPRAA